MEQAPFNNNQSYNSTRHSTTGFAPIHAESGSRPQIDRSIPLLKENDNNSNNKIQIKNQINNTIKNNIEKKAMKMKEKYDKKIHYEKLEIGDFVLIANAPFYNKKKKSDIFEYEGIIEEVLDNYKYRIIWTKKGYLLSHVQGSSSVLPISHLKKFPGKILQIEDKLFGDEIESVFSISDDNYMEENIFNNNETYCDNVNDINDQINNDQNNNDQINSDQINSNDDQINNDHQINNQIIIHNNTPNDKNNNNDRSNSKMRNKHSQKEFAHF